MSVDLLAIANERPRIMAHLMSNISELLSSGKINPLGSVTIFPISDVETAFKVLNSGNVSGKLVVVPRDNDQVKVSLPSRVNICLGEFSLTVLGDLFKQEEQIA